MISGANDEDPHAVDLAIDARNFRHKAIKTEASSRPPAGPAHATEANAISPTVAALPHSATFAHPARRPRGASSVTGQLTGVDARQPRGRRRYDAVRRAAREMRTERQPGPWCAIVLTETGWR